MYIDLQVIFPLFLSDFNETWISSTHFEKYTNTAYYKIRLVGTELFHADRRTDMTKLMVAFSNFAIGPTKSDSLSENSFEYLFYAYKVVMMLYVLLFCFRRNIPVINRKDLSRTVHKIHAEYRNEPL
jgi:hypothetical protein